MRENKSITISAILAGGESRRMGTDKAALEVEGVSLLQRTVQTVKSAGQRVLVVGRLRPEGWPKEYSESEHRKSENGEFIADAEPGLGPLGGLRTALRYARVPMLALACDLPLLTPDAVRWLGTQWTQTQAGPGGEHGLIVVSHGRWEPLFSVYCPACLPLIEARLAEGRRSVHGLIEAGQFAVTDAPDWVTAQLVNVNTPQQWQALQKSGKP